MLRLVLPSALVLIVLYVVITAARAWRQHGSPRRRTWALFVARDGWRSKRLRRRIEAADPTGRVVAYRLDDHAELAARLGVDEVPTLVLGDGEGGARVRLAGRRAIDGYLSRRSAR